MQKEKLQEFFRKHWSSFKKNFKNDRQIVDKCWKMTNTVLVDKIIKQNSLANRTINSYIKSIGVFFANIFRSFSSVFFETGREAKFV